VWALELVRMSDRARDDRRPPLGSGTSAEREMTDDELSEPVSPARSRSTPRSRKRSGRQFQNTETIRRILRESRRSPSSVSRTSDRRSSHFVADLPSACRLSVIPVNRAAAPCSARLSTRISPAYRYRSTLVIFRRGGYGAHGRAAIAKGCRESGSSSGSGERAAERAAPLGWRW